MDRRHFVVPGSTGMPRSARHELGVGGLTVDPGGDRNPEPSRPFGTVLGVTDVDALPA